MLVNLLKRAKLDAKLSLISKFKGSLYGQLPKGISKNFLFGMQFGGIGSRFYNKIRRLFSVDQILKANSNGTWYINTIVLPDILKYAEQNNIKTIVHIHELRQMYAGSSDDHISRLVNYPSLIIANSVASADVIRNYGRRDRIEIVYPPLSEELTGKTKFIDKQNAMGVSEEDFVWVMCGTLDSNKNPFLFLEIASELKKREASFKMVWIGGKSDDSDIDVQCAQKVKELQLVNEVRFISDVKNEFYDYFSRADGFVLTSQFESFSLTTLEALYFQLPVVANDCVGVKEILGTEFGYIVREKNNAKEFASKMLDYMSKPLMNEEKLKQRALDFSIDKISARWNEVMNKNV